MANPRIYIESSCFIDLVKHQAKQNFSKDSSEQAQREKDVWSCNQLLKASIAGKVDILTSFITVAECTHLQDGKPTPSEDVKAHYNALFLSGRGGVVLAQTVLAIAELARNLRWVHNIYLKGVDSLHLATACHHKCEEFLTRDQPILKNRNTIEKTFKMKVITPSETSVLPSEFKQPDLPEMESPK